MQEAELADTSETKGGNIWKTKLISLNQTVVGPCHHSMARPQVVDRGRPPIRRVAANKLNKRLQRADEGWSSSLGVGQGANNPSL